MTAIYETADAAGDATTRYALTEGDVFFGKLKTNADDWVRVHLVAGQTYSFAAVGLGAANAGVVDPLLSLHAADGTLLAQDNDSGPGFSASLTFTAFSTGTYYVEAFALQSGADAGYGLSMTAGSRPSLGVEMAAAVLDRPGQSWATGPETPVTVTWAVRAFGPTFDGLPLQVLDSVQIEGLTRAMANYSDVANVTFVQVAPGGTSNDATILVGGYYDQFSGASAYATFPGSTDPGSADGDVWVNNYWAHAFINDLPFGSAEYLVYLHELGHALGLAHPGDYNGGGFSYAGNAQFVEDSTQYTVMSYFAAHETEPASPGFQPGTLMMFDIYAAQQLYGVNHATRSGNDTYGFHSTVGGAYDFDLYTVPQICIWDGAGKDTLDVSGYGAAQRVDLNDGSFSDVGGYRGNVSIALGAVIENAVGGTGRDTLQGNEVGNALRGGGGRDVLVGGAGADVLTGGAGADTMNGGAGADRFVFKDKFGADQIRGFDAAADKLLLDPALWSGVALTPDMVVSSFATAQGGAAVLDFGSHGVLTLLNTGLADLQAAIVIQ